MKTKYIIPTNKVVPLVTAVRILNGSSPDPGVGFDKPDIIKPTPGSDDFGDLFN